MKIALLTHSTNPRGGVVHTLELASALHDQGHDVTLIAPGERLFRAVPHRVSLVPVPPVPRDTVAMAAQRIAAIREHVAALPDRAAFDVWHAQDSLSANALADLVERGAIDGFVRTVHHLDVFDDARLMHWQQRGFSAARQVLCVSPLWCRTLRDEHGIEAGLVHNGVDLRRYGPAPDARDAEVAARLGLRPGAPLWLAVGGVEERKNTLRLLRAFALHRRERPAAQLAIVGGASLLDHGAHRAAFDADAAAFDADALRLTGPLPDGDMPALFRLADGLLMPSLREGFGLVVLEALASGTPVVVSRQPPFTEYLAEADASWADPLDVDSIAAAMAHALANPRNGAVPEVCCRHSWPASAARHVALYERLPATA